MKFWHLPIIGVLSFSLACKADDEPTVSRTTESPRTSDNRRSAVDQYIETALVSNVPTRAALTLNGMLAYTDNGYSRVSSPLKGRVLEVRARLGDRVEAEDVLLVVDSPDIAEAYSNFIRENSELHFAKQSYGLALDLYQNKAISLKDFKQAENDFIKAQAEYRRAKANLLSLRIPSAELDKPISEQHVTSRFALRSPLTGTVVERAVTPGQSVGDGLEQVLFIVAELQSLQIIADVYERDLAHIRIDQEASFTVEAYPNLAFAATVSAIGDVVDPNTRTIKIRARAQNTDRTLKPGMFANLRIELTDGTPFFAVPKQSVIVINGQHYVYIEQGGRFSKRAVKVRATSGDVIHVLEGLTGGERLVTKGLVFLEPKHATG
jgi:cobalt-zinc-cadmium efflux system membrane fusion protein